MRGLMFIGIALLSSVVGVFGTSCVTVGDPAVHIYLQICRFVADMD